MSVLRYFSFLWIISNTKRTDFLNTDKMLQLLTEPMSDVVDKDSNKDEMREENKYNEDEICSETDNEEEAEDRMNSFYLWKDKTTKQGKGTSQKKIQTHS